MAEPRFVFDATPDNFHALALANSEKGPVAVNFWSPRAGPCRMLMPRLLKLAEEFGGRFLLVRLDTDAHGRLARDWGVTSIPTTKVFRHGKVVDTLYGAESEASVRAFLRKHVGGESAGLRVARRPGRAHGAGRSAGAARRGQTARAARALCPGRGVARGVAGGAAGPDFSLRRARRPTSRRWRGPSPPTRPDLEARYRLAAVCLTRDDYDTALVQLLEIARRDRRYRDGVGRVGLLALFDLLGEQDPRTRHYREELQKIIK